MDDRNIVKMLWNRDESAIGIISEKYAKYCTAIARNITGNKEDAEECVNEAYQKVWQSVPPNKPPSLKNYIGKITRNLAFNMYARSSSEKRGGNSFDSVLYELEECLHSSGSDTESEFDKKELIKEINDFLWSLPSDKRKLFVSRYWYADNMKDIALRYGISENNAAVSLQRIRTKLRKYLNERGYNI
ncbi:MAG: sigma-70 family RNA polymerase sigma factor [Oscillospiraceae bacterium]|nr:sigma-70 family RNA polymerase sigma factor [Oscillospiraceae bacterium]